jgi:hypothetical protein
MVCMTHRWRGADSNFRFRATLGGHARLRSAQSGQSIPDYASYERLLSVVMLPLAGEPRQTGALGFEEIGFISGRAAGRPRC